MRREELERIAESVDERRGWDFSSMRTDSDPIPWDYADVVRVCDIPEGRLRILANVISQEIVCFFE